MYASYGLFIDGAWSGAPRGGATEIVDPGTGDVIGSVPVATVEDTKAAIDVAAKAFETWRSTPAWTRADLLHKVADVMVRRQAEGARQMTLETGNGSVGLCFHAERGLGA